MFASQCWLRFSAHQDQGGHVVLLRSTSAKNSDATAQQETELPQEAGTTAQQEGKSAEQDVTTAQSSQQEMTTSDAITGSTDPGSGQNAAFISSSLGLRPVTETRPVPKMRLRRADPDGTTSPAAPAASTATPAEFAAKPAPPVDSAAALAGPPVDSIAALAAPPAAPASPSGSFRPPAAPGRPSSATQETRPGPITRAAPPNQGGAGTPAGSAKVEPATAKPATAGSAAAEPPTPAQTPAPSPSPSGVRPPAGSATGSRIGREPITTPMARPKFVAKPTSDPSATSGDASHAAQAATSICPPVPDRPPAGQHAVTTTPATDGQTKPNPGPAPVAQPAGTQPPPAAKRAPD